MDGGGLFTIIFRVYGPLLKPPIVALTIVTFLYVWNDYLWPSFTYSAYRDYVPITLRVQGITLGNSSSGTVNYPAMMIRVFMATWPPALVYFLLQRYFIQGLVASGLKG
jgi:multiple sugar transport system permease protein